MTTPMSKTDIFWELAHVNRELNMALKTHAASGPSGFGCRWLESRIESLREQREILERLYDER